jgi:hypothetical protein
MIREVCSIWNGNYSVIIVSRFAILPENFIKKGVISGSSECDLKRQGKSGEVLKFSTASIGCGVTKLVKL